MQFQFQKHLMKTPYSSFPRLLLNIKIAICGCNKVKSLWIMIIFLVLIYPPLEARQAHLKDSLQQAFREAINDVDKFELLIKLSDAVLYNSPEESLERSFSALEIAKNIADVEKEAIALNRIGSAYWNIGDLAKSYEYQIMALNIANTNDLEAIKARCLGNIGTLLSAIGNDIQAIEYEKEALSIVEKKNNDKNRRVALHNNIGRSHFHLKQVDSAEMYLEKARTLAFGEERFMLPIILFNLGELYFYENALPKATALLEECLELALQYNDIRSQCRVYQLLAEIAMKEDREKEKSLFYAKNAAMIAETTKTKELIYITYNTYANALGLNEKYKEAFEYGQKSNAYRDSVQQSQTTQKLAFFNYQRDQGELALLKKENQLASLMKERSSLYIKGLTIGIVLVILFLIVIIISRKEKIEANKKLARINKEVKNQKRAIDAHRRKLESINKSKDKVFSVVSHDFRSPLNSLKSLLVMIQDDYISMDEFKNLLPEVSRKLNSASTLLENILLWAQVQINHDHFKAKMVDISKEVLKQKTFCADQLALKNLTLDIAIPEKTEAYIDPDILGFVIRNMIVNAIKFSNEHNSIKITSTSDSDYCHLHITDHGIGMSEVEVEKLFQNVGKSKEGTSGEKGTGFGLRLSQDFIENSGGYIKVESELGKGTTFTIAIPNFQINIASENGQQSITDSLQTN